MDNLFMYNFFKEIINKEILKTYFTYKDIKNEYKEDDYFDKILVKINIKINDPNIGNLSSYEIKNLEINSDEGINKNFLEKVKEIKDEIENDIDQYRNHQKKEWNLFYLYKEFFQKLDTKSNYYRGQSTNWPMYPGVLRDNTNTEFQTKFEIIYQNIMYRYPDIIEYYAPKIDREIIENREQQLAHLQHYGLKTSLIDITENPYIALLFMVSESSKKDFKNALIDIYNINLKDHSERNIFSKVKMLKTNSRIIAQKGAFFNFDKVSLGNQDIEKIPLVRLQLNPHFEVLDEREKLLEKIEESFKKINEKIQRVIKEISNLDGTGEIKQDTEINMNSSVLELILEQEKIKENIKNLKKEIKYLKNYYDKISLDSIRYQIKQKLEEYHYKESELFPDLYKHIGYVQAGYEENKEQIRKPKLKLSKKEDNTKNELFNMMLDN